MMTDITQLVREWAYYIWEETARPEGLGGGTLANGRTRSRGKGRATNLRTMPGYQERRPS
jgi:hypothetical protein